MTNVTILSRVFEEDENIDRNVHIVNTNILCSVCGHPQPNFVHDSGMLFVEPCYNCIAVAKQETFTSNARMDDICGECDQYNDGYHEGFDDGKDEGQNESEIRCEMHEAIDNCEFLPAKTLDKLHTTLDEDLFPNRASRKLYWPDRLK